MTTAYSKPPDNAIVQYGKALRSAGVVVVPVTEDGLKTINHLSPTPTTDPTAPRAKWSQHRTTSIPDDVFEEVFRGRTGIGVITGVAFRDDGLELGMVEIDDPELIDLVLDIAEAARVEVVPRVFRDGLVVRTPGGGLHGYYLCSDVPKNTKLAGRPAPTKNDPNAVDTLIESRGTSGFAVTAPSSGSVHPSGGPYELVHGDPSAPPVLTVEEQEELFNFLRMFDERPRKEVKPRLKDVTVDGDRPGDRFNAAARMETFQELLPGWEWLFESGGVWCLRRPGKDRGVSATYNFAGLGMLYVFTSSTALESEAMYSAFALYTTVHHGGDWGAAAGELYRQGYGKRPYVEFDTSDEGPPEGSDAVRAIPLSNTLFVAEHRFWSKEGFVPVPLTNAEIRISHYITEEIAPGEFRHFYRMAGVLATGVQLPPADIPTDDLGSIQQWTGRNGHLWARVTLEPGFTVRDQVRACIQHYSQHVGIEAIQRYSETGWCEVEGARVFRTHLSAIGVDGIRPDVDVQLDHDFARYSLTRIPAKDALLELGKRYLRTLDLAQAPILAPVVLTPPRAVLNPFLPVDSVVYLHGPTGSFKTELSVLAMAHFGRAFTSRSIPLSFEGTSNSTQAATWRLKDVVTVVDDMAPEGTPNRVGSIYSKLSTLARSIGNRSGRTRANADMTAKQTFYPRGVVIASGEDLPRGHSAAARMQTVEVTRADIDAVVLSDCQAMAAEGVYADLMAVFIQYVAGHWDEITAGIDGLYAKALSQMRSQSFKHRRTADALAPQLVVAQVWFEWLRAIGSVNAAERDALIEWAKEGLLASGGAQDEVQAEANPVEIFLSNIRSAVIRGDAHLADRESNECPHQPARFSWKTETRKVGDHIEPFSVPKGSMIGWVDIAANAVYLDPDSAYAVAQDLGARTGRNIPMTVTTLGKRLLDAKHIVSTEAGRVKQRVYVNRAPQRAWHLRLSDLFPEAEAIEGDVEPTPFSRRVVA